MIRYITLDALAKHCDIVIVSVKKNENKCNALKCSVRFVLFRRRIYVRFIPIFNPMFHQRDQMYNFFFLSFFLSKLTIACNRCGGNMMPMKIISCFFFGLLLYFPLSIFIWFLFSLCSLSSSVSCRGCCCCWLNINNGNNNDRTLTLFMSFVASNFRPSTCVPVDRLHRFNVTETQQEKEKNANEK